LTIKIYKNYLPAWIILDPRY